MNTIKKFSLTTRIIIGMVAGFIIGQLLQWLMPNGSDLVIPLYIADLSLRNLDGDKNLDDFLKLLWQTHGKAEIPYTVRDLQNVLANYTDETFATNFFSNYIFESKMPDYRTLLASVGVNFEQSKQNELSLGARFRNFKVVSNPSEGSAAYKAGLAYGDEIISMDSISITSETKQSEYFTQFKPNQSVKVIFKRFGEQKETLFTFGKNNDYSTNLQEKVGKKITNNRKAWLGFEK